MSTDDEYREIVNELSLFSFTLKIHLYYVVN